MSGNKTDAGRASIRLGAVPDIGNEILHALAQNPFQPVAVFRIGPMQRHQLPADRSHLLIDRSKLCVVRDWDACQASGSEFSGHSRNRRIAWPVSFAMADAVACFKLLITETLKLLTARSAEQLHIRIAGVSDEHNHSFNRPSRRI